MMSFLPIAIDVRHLWVRKGGGLFGQTKSILQDVSFTVLPGEFLGVVGPNGAGKTTMLRAMVGEKPAYGQILLKQGDELYESLYDNPEYWLRKVGYVPVDNVLHDDLTVRQALMHIGKLRLPDLSENEIQDRIVEKLSSFGFKADDSRLDQLVKSLSSGEKKKVNIATELLTNPPLLLLDEPTSNLDPNAERDLMNNLRDISGMHTQGQGPTVLLITHTLESLDRCDKVAFVANSRLQAYGRPEEVFQQLTQEMPPELRKTNNSRFEQWAAIFEQHNTNEAVAKRTENVPPPHVQHPVAPKRPAYQDRFWRQFRIQFSRYYTLRFNDLNGVLAILVSGFVVGFLMMVAPPEVFLRPDSSDATAARQTVVLYTILVVIMGAFISHREISKEFRLYLHERTKGLDPLAYVLSKTIWLSVIIGVVITVTILALSGLPIARLLTLALGLVVACITVARVAQNRALPAKERTRQILQGFALALPLLASYFIQLQLKVLPTTPIDPTLVEVIVTISLIFASVAALTLGLLISAVVGGNNDRATQFVIAAILINVVLAFSALVIAAPNVQELFNRLEPFAVTHWGYRGFASGISLYCWAGQIPFENFNSWGHFLMTWIVLIAQIVAVISLAVLVLRLQETWMDLGRKVRSIALSPGTYVALSIVICLLSWALFLAARSDDYFRLTFYDRLDGQNRYARIENVQTASALQTIDGVLSQSYCGVDQILQQPADRVRLYEPVEENAS